MDCNDQRASSSANLRVSHDLPRSGERHSAFGMGQLALAAKIQGTGCVREAIRCTSLSPPSHR